MNVRVTRDGIVENAVACKENNSNCDVVGLARIPQPQSWSFQD